MGTFIIRPTRLTQGGNQLICAFNATNDYAGWLSDPNIVNPPTPLIDIFKGPADGIHIAQAGVFTNLIFPTIFKDTLRFDFIGNSIYLDGSNIPISFSGLPAGWTPLTAILTLNPTPTVEQFAPDFANYYLQFDTFTEGLVNTPSFLYPGNVPSAFSLINNGCGLRVSLSVSIASSLSSIFNIQELTLSGTYGISSFTTTLENSDIPVKTGDIIRISSSIISLASGAGAGSGGGVQQGILDSLEQVQLSFIDPVTELEKIIYIDQDINYYYIIFWFSYLFWFYLPIGFENFEGKVQVTLIFNGTSFSGSIMLGNLDVFFEDASGIYVLDNNQTNDLLYFRNGITSDVHVLMLSDFFSDSEFSGDDFFNILPFPRKILAENYLENDDFELDDFLITANTRVVVVTKNVEIPSPFVKTAFLP